MVFEILLSMAAWASLPLRLALGVAFVFHGYPKLFGPGAKQTRDYMKTVGVPPLLTTLTALLELLGGIALVIGFLTPIVGILIAFEMVATTFLSKAKLQKKSMLGYELDIAYLAMALALVVLGGGPTSLDTLLGL
ncbi:MAG TPA: DoxX family protein [Candidatus Bathyarchaeia archaeon]|nr:DoxX family protein [Candidatus Bathyarchaeia archaeon]